MVAVMFAATLRFGEWGRVSRPAYPSLDRGADAAPLAYRIHERVLMGVVTARGLLGMGLAF